MVVSINERLFTKEVLVASTPVLVYFWAPWCGVCRLIEPILAHLESEWGGAIKIVSFNADDSLKIANTYRLRTLPTLILFDQGEVKYRLEGYHGGEDIRIQLEALYLEPAHHPAFTDESAIASSILA